MVATRTRGVGQTAQDLTVGVVFSGAEQPLEILAFRVDDRATDRVDGPEVAQQVAALPGSGFHHRIGS